MREHGTPQMQGKRYSCDYYMEIYHAIENEMVVKLGDIIFRRTDLGTGSHPGNDVIAECAEILAKKMGWSSKRMQSEIDQVNARFINYS